MKFYFITTAARFGIKNKNEVDKLNEKRHNFTYIHTYIHTDRAQFCPVMPAILYSFPRLKAKCVYGF